MFYDLINPYVVNQQSMNVFVQGNPVAATTVGKFGYYDADNDVIYLYPNEEKRLRTLLFSTKADSIPNTFVFEGEYEIKDAPNEHLLKYTRK